MTDERRPTLLGTHVTVRPGQPEDLPAVYAILHEPSVVRWWREPAPLDQLQDQLWGMSEEPMLVIEVADEVAGGIQYAEELDPDYRHASIDLFLGERWQGRGFGTEALRLVARFLFTQRGHHRLTIDPAADSVHAIASYTKVGFHPVGTMRAYERHTDGSWQDGLLMDLLRADLQ